MRISELYSLKPSDIDFESNNILIYGKGAKERIIQLGNQDVINALILYQETFKRDIKICGYFFVNRLQHKLSDQSVRFMIRDRRMNEHSVNKSNELGISMQKNFLKLNVYTWYFQKNSKIYLDFILW